MLQGPTPNLLQHVSETQMLWMKVRDCYHSNEFTHKYEKGHKRSKYYKKIINIMKLILTIWYL